MRKIRIAMAFIAVLIGAFPAGSLAGNGKPLPMATPLEARTCVNPRTAPLKLAQGVILCCCIEAATKGQCCNYVNATVCTPQVPGCGC